MRLNESNTYPTNRHKILKSVMSFHQINFEPGCNSRYTNFHINSVSEREKFTRRVIEAYLGCWFEISTSSGVHVNITNQVVHTGFATIILQ